MIVFHLESLVNPKKVSVQAFDWQMNGVDSGKMADRLNAGQGGELLPYGHTVTARGKLLAMAQP